MNVGLLLLFIAGVIMATTTTAANQTEFELRLLVSLLLALIGVPVTLYVIGTPLSRQHILPIVLGQIAVYAFGIVTFIAAVKLRPVAQLTPR